MLRQTSTVHQDRNSQTQNRRRTDFGQLQVLNTIQLYSSETGILTHTDVINRIIWDGNFDSQNYRIIYEDRFNGRLEVNLASWKKDLTDEEFIPQHRILYIERKSDHEVVWDKRRRIDKVFYSGNSAYSWLAFLS